MEDGKVSGDARMLGLISLIVCKRIDSFQGLRCIATAGSDATKTSMDSDGDGVGLNLGVIIRLTRDWAGKFRGCWNFIRNSFLDDLQ